ncbi:hypothetical protein PYCC9005_005925 [Savitreella phatthalungensis]
MSRRPKSRRPAVDIGLAVGAVALTAFAASAVFYMYHQGEDDPSTPGAESPAVDDAVTRTSIVTPSAVFKRPAVRKSGSRHRRRRIFVAAGSVDEITALLPDDAAIYDDVYVALYCGAGASRQTGSRTPGGGAAISGQSSRFASRRGSTSRPENAPLHGLTSRSTENEHAIASGLQTPRHQHLQDDDPSSRRSSLASRLSASLTSLANDPPELRSYMWSSAHHFPTEQQRFQSELSSRKGTLFTHVLFHETRQGAIHLARHLGPLDLVIICRSMCPAHVHASKLRDRLSKRFSSTASLTGMHADALLADPSQHAPPTSPPVFDPPEDYDPARDLSKWSRRVVLLSRKRSPTGGGAGVSRRNSMSANAAAAAAAAEDDVSGTPANVRYISENAYEDVYEVALAA